MPVETQRDIYSVTCNWLLQYMQQSPFGPPDFWTPAAPLPEPTRALPRTEEKLRVMSERYFRRVRLFHPDDAKPIGVMPIIQETDNWKLRVVGWRPDPEAKKAA